MDKYIIYIIHMNGLQNFKLSACTNCTLLSKDVEKFSEFKLNVPLTYNYTMREVF